MPYNFLCTFLYPLIHCMLYYLLSLSHNAGLCTHNNKCLTFYEDKESNFMITTSFQIETRARSEDVIYFYSNFIFNRTFLPQSKANSLFKSRTKTFTSRMSRKTAHIRHIFLISNVTFIGRHLRFYLEVIPKSFRNGVARSWISIYIDN